MLQAGLHKAGSCQVGTGGSYLEILAKVHRRDAEDAKKTKIFLSVYYLKEAIEDYFKDGKKFGVEISYLYEAEPLGTAGCLGLLSPDMIPNSSFLVLNGDLLTDINFSVIRDFHDETNYDFTICSMPYKVQIPFGCPIVEGDIVTGFAEKPEHIYLVNAGIYCLSPFTTPIYQFRHIQIFTRRYMAEQ